MAEFHYVREAIYIFENPKAQRVKVGYTGGLTGVGGRLKDINDMWRAIKVTCQVCGTRLHNVGRLVPKHPKNSPRACPGGNALPLERDVSLAESHLEEMKKNILAMCGTEKGSTTRRINTLEKRIEKYRNHFNHQPVGNWQFIIAYYTESANQIELRAHELLAPYLDKAAPFGEVFCCSVSETTEAVETALSESGLLHSARKETQLRAAR